MILSSISDISLSFKVDYLLINPHYQFLHEHCWLKPFRFFYLPPPLNDLNEGYLSRQGVKAIISISNNLNLHFECKIITFLCKRQTLSHFSTTASFTIIQSVQVAITLPSLLVRLSPTGMIFYNKHNFRNKYQQIMSSTSKKLCFLHGKLLLLLHNLLSLPNAGQFSKSGRTARGVKTITKSL